MIVLRAAVEGLLPELSCRGVNERLVEFADGVPNGETHQGRQLAMYIQAAMDILRTTNDLLPPARTRRSESDRREWRVTLHAPCM